MDVRLPDISGKTDEAVITLWHIAVNDRVEKDQDIVEVVTDKATFDVSSPCAGTVTGILKLKGEQVKADEVIAIIE
ncbi:MAG: lipoyl domain-containing protein [Candidatus Tantalella remota]|nr:lipoyl domain-containing protein [Candidatus Tantalella remota]